MVREITIFLSSLIKSQIMIPQKCKTSVKYVIVVPILLEMMENVAHFSWILGQKYKNGVKIGFVCLKLTEMMENVAHFS